MKNFIVFSTGSGCMTDWHLKTYINDPLFDQISLVYTFLHMALFLSFVSVELKIFPNKNNIQTTSDQSNEKLMVNLFKSSIILPNRKTNTETASLIRLLLTSGIFVHWSTNLANKWLPCWVQHDKSASKDTNGNKGHECYSKKQKQ